MVVGGGAPSGERLLRRILSPLRTRARGAPPPPRRRQVILNALGDGTKAFELAPPLPGSRPESAWLPPAEAPPPGATAAPVRLGAGDVLYLPARWCHRVVTAGPSMTVNWGFYPDPGPE